MHYGYQRPVEILLFIKGTWQSSAHPQRQTIAAIRPVQGGYVIVYAMIVQTEGRQRTYCVDWFPGGYSGMGTGQIGAVQDLDP